MFILVAEIDNNIIGYAAVSIEKLSWRLYNPIAEIKKLCVNPLYRGKGVGTMLMQEISNIVKKRGVKRLNVIVLSNNNPALRFYRNNGYKDVDIILEKDII